MKPRLAQKYQIDEAGRQDRKDFLSLTAEDEALIPKLQQWFAEIAPEFAEDFYKHLLAHPHTARFLREPDLLDRLKLEQLRYFEELVSGEYGEEYFEKRLQVGETHERRGLEPRWYLGAYSLYIQLAFPGFARRLGTELPAELMALLKVILLDIGLALETYYNESSETLRRRNADLREALQLYHQTEIKAKQYAKLAGHEIRGSLNAIANACEEVVEDFQDQIPEEAWAVLKEAQQRCWQVSGVVESILSEPELAGQPSLVDVGNLLDDVAGRLNIYASGRKVHLKLLEKSVEVWADPVGLREIFANLISNAVHHLDKEPGQVTVEYEPTGQLHVFCVSDNGPGIPVDSQQQIFEPFYRAPGSGHCDGKGLGLYFVRQIVQQHGGHAWVDSVPGQGSRFSFSLPKHPLTESVTKSPLQ